MRIVTTGGTYLDIDAYAGCVAYAELLNLEGHEAIAADPAPQNSTITRTVRSWQAPLQTDYVAQSEDTFTLIDISNPDWIKGFVDLERVDEVIDHHVGYEQYWQDRIGNRSMIDFIGAACTLVYERWQQADQFDRMSERSARLLMCGILDNTLNFGAEVTTDRDKVAYDSLARRANLPDDWPATYFTECTEAIAANAIESLANDTKLLTLKTFPEQVALGQLAVWDAVGILQANKQVITEYLQSLSPQWALNLIDIKNRQSIFLAQDAALQDWITRTLDVQFDGDMAAADRLWLRKEIIRQDLQAK